MHVRASAVLAAALALGPAVAGAGDVHRCPQPDGTMRFQDRPCEAVAAPPATAPPGPRRGRPPAATATAAPAPAAPPELPAPPARRADYVAANEARCRDGERRACAAVTCERSGGLDSPACQEAVGYVRGPGWDLRPRSDLFDPAAREDAFTLACRPGGRQAVLIRARGATAWRFAARPDAAPVERDGLGAAARAFCAGGDAAR
jgi:hypothetical protein